MSNIIVKKLWSPIRLSDYVHIAFPDLLTKSMGKKCVKKGYVSIDGRTGYTSDWVENGMSLSLNLPQQVESSKNNRSLTVLYEDDHLAVIVKPAGINVSGNRASIMNSLVHNLIQSEENDALYIPLPIHRLDRDTKGLLLIAKTRTSHLILSERIANHELVKEYHALCAGSFESSSGSIDIGINGKKAFTSYLVLEALSSKRFGTLSLLKVKIDTGRTHQIRIHLSNLGHPIIGDSLYCNGMHVNAGKGLFLYATGLSFVHPISNLMVNVNMDLPPKVMRMMNFEAKD